LKIELFGLLQSIFEKGGSEFLLELMTPEFTQLIFAAASGQADDVLEPFLGLLEMYLSRFGKEMGRYEAVDTVFKEGIVELLCETREVSVAFRAKAEGLLEAYYPGQMGEV
jgi:hypothetical protein